MLETKDTSASALKKKKKVFTKNFQAISIKKKRSSHNFFKRSPQNNVFQKIFQALHKILTIQKIVLSSSRGQANFRGLEAKDLTFKAKDFKMCPRGQGRPRGLHFWYKHQKKEHVSSLSAYNPRDVHWGMCR